MRMKEGIVETVNEKRKVEPSLQYYLTNFLLKAARQGCLGGVGKATDSHDLHT